VLRVFAVDDVHFTPECYAMIALSIANLLESRFNKQNVSDTSGPSSVSGMVKNYYWRGF
jgi:hypothetical protein